MIDTLSELVSLLREHGVPCDWENTGGGCMVIMIDSPAGDVTVVSDGDTVTPFYKVRMPRDVWYFGTAEDRDECHGETGECLDAVDLLDRV